jgi:hypothetical protein
LSKNLTQFHIQNPAFFTEALAASTIRVINDHCPDDEGSKDF